MTTHLLIQVLLTISLVPESGDTEQNETKAMHMSGGYPNQEADNKHVNK